MPALRDYASTGALLLVNHRRHTIGRDQRDAIHRVCRGPATGLAGVVGTLLGGWANDHFGALATLRVQISVLMASMVVLPFTQGNYALTLTAFIVWGIAGLGGFSL